MNSLNLLLFENVFISHLSLKVSFVECRILGCQSVSQHFKNLISLSDLQGF